MTRGYELCHERINRNSKTKWLMRDSFLISGPKIVPKYKRKCGQNKISHDSHQAATEVTGRKHAAYNFKFATFIHLC